MKKMIFLVLVLTAINIALAQPLPLEEFPLDTLISNSLQPLLEKAGIFVGGIFGLYFILTLIQIYNERKKVKLLKDIRNDVDLLTKHFGVKHSHDKRGIFRRIFGFLLHDEEEIAKKPKK